MLSGKPSAFDPTSVKDDRLGWRLSWLKGTETSVTMGVQQVVARAWANLLRRTRRPLGKMVLKPAPHEARRSVRTLDPVRPLRGGRGGNGAVWEVDDGIGGRAALKYLHRTRGDGPARFAREVEAMRSCSDVSGVMPIYDSDIDPAIPVQWYTMPLAEPLSRVTSELDSLQAIVQVCRSLASTLASLHSRGYSHRDIKPENIFRLEGEWYLGDFGLVDHAESASLTPNDRKLGPTFYIAPEMLNSPANANGRAADVYSLAKLLWKLATGQNYPNPGRHDRYRPAMTISAWTEGEAAVPLDALIDSMTDEDPTVRPSMDVVGAELARWLERGALQPEIAPLNLAEIADRLRSMTEAHRADMTASKRRRERITSDTNRIYGKVRDVVVQIHGELVANGVGAVSPSDAVSLRTGLGGFSVDGPDGRDFTGRRMQFSTPIQSRHGMVQLVGRADLLHHVTNGETDPDKPVTFRVQYLLTAYPSGKPQPEVSAWEAHETFLPGLPSEETALVRFLQVFALSFPRPLGRPGTLSPVSLADRYLHRQRRHAHRGRASTQSRG